VALTVEPRGSLSDYRDKTRGSRQFRGAADLNLLGPATNGTRRLENAGPVSVTLRCDSTATLPHTTRVTLFRDSDRVEIANEITANFSSVQRWQFSFNLTNVDTWHEEVGALTRARLTTAGGHYSPSNARYDFLTLNHFADMSGRLEGDGPFGVTLANADTYFMQLGNSTTASLDVKTPRLSAYAGGQLGGFGCAGQDHDAYFLQRFALRTHDAYDPAAAMRFALEHQNPLVCALITGATNVYPGTTFRFGTVANTNVLVWALKPAEEGVTHGVILRVWNLGTNAADFSFSANGNVTNAIRCTHIETDLEPASVAKGAITATLPAQRMETYRLFLDRGSVGVIHAP
jgi:alpha-mannosidase